MKEKSLLKKISSWYFTRQVLPYWCILLLDSLIVFLACILTYWVSNRTYATFDNRIDVFQTALLYAVMSWLGARIFRTYSGIVRYSSFVDLLKLLYANAVTLALAMGSMLLFNWLKVKGLCAFSGLEIVVAAFIGTAAMWGVRVMVKLMYDISKSNNQAVRVLIYGALSGGIGVAKSINSQSPLQFDLQGFISHDSSIKDMHIMGVPVYIPDDNIAEVIKKRHIQAVLVSPLRVDDFRNNQALQDIFISAGCKIYMVQKAKEANVENGELSEGEEQGIHMKEVSVEDLLPRQEIHVDMKSVEALLEGKRVLITGSAGSIGMEIVRQVAAFKPAKMMLIDQAETPQHDVTLMMKREFPDVPCEVVVTSISRRTRMEWMFDNFRPDYVFHAAAYKHVPMMEDNPSEAVMNNIYGTKVIADMSVKYGVKKFVMVSTDKAVNPTNVMGCSKRICEIYVQSLDRKLKTQAMAQFKEKGSTSYTQFVTTRFGNVLGSNGSVIPIFREQIKRGGPVTVTDERIVRFFMLIPEACKLVLEAGTMGNGGEIFVFDMGNPVKIIDLAKRMIALSGAKDVEIKITGLRDGEKLYEEMLNDMESTKPTFHEKIRIASVREYDYDEVNVAIEELIDLSKQFDKLATVKKMQEIVPEYVSTNPEYKL